MSARGNIATVSFKLTPAYYTVLQALAAAEGKRVSALVRETVVESLDLERQTERLQMLFVTAAQE